MKIAEIKVGDRLEDYRRRVTFVVTSLDPCGSCACGNGDIRFTELWKTDPLGATHKRFRNMTYRQFERLRFVRRVENGPR